MDRWTNFAGIEDVRASIALESTASSARAASRVVLATARFRLIDTNVCTDLTYALDQMNDYLGMFADALDRSDKAGLDAGNWSNRIFLFAELVVVDEFWRGGRLGPALVAYVADMFRADFIFLRPTALRTYVDANGVCRPRDTPYTIDYTTNQRVEAKARKVWQRAGFRSLGSGFWWQEPCPDQQGIKARKRITRVERVAKNAEVIAWWHRRVRRQMS